MIIKFIPSRIGEPLTCFAMHNDVVIFGSISGYVGFYNIKANNVMYDYEHLYEVISTQSSQ